MSITSFASGVCAGFVVPTTIRLGIGAFVESVLPSNVAMRIKCLAAVIIPSAFSCFTISEDASFDTGYRMGISASAFISGQAVGREVTLIKTKNTHLSNDRALREEVLAKLLDPVEAIVTAATIGITYNWPPAGIACSSFLGFLSGKKITKAILNERQQIVVL